MRKLAVLGSVVLSFALVAPTAAVSDASWTATLAQSGISGTVTVTITGTTGTVAENLKGLTPRAVSVLWLRGGTCAATGFGVARIRWIAPASGHLVHSAQLSPAMVGFFTFDLKNRGGVHATLSGGSHEACAQLAPTP